MAKPAFYRRFATDFVFDLICIENCFRNKAINILFEFHVLILLIQNMELEFANMPKNMPDFCWQSEQNLKRLSKRNWRKLDTRVNSNQIWLIAGSQLVG